MEQRETGEGSDRERIIDLLPQLAQANDLGTLEDYGACLTEDAVVNFPTGEIESGREAVLAHQRKWREIGAVGPGSHTQHFVTTTSVRVSGAAANAVSYIMVVKTERGNPVPKKQLVYRDHILRTGVGWRVAERIINAP